MKKKSQILSIRPTISLDKWKAMTARNCRDSYSLAVQLAILLLWEDEVEGGTWGEKILANNISGLSGAQAHLAINFSKQFRPAWLTKKNAKA